MKNNIEEAFELISLNGNTHPSSELFDISRETSLWQDLAYCSSSNARHYLPYQDAYRLCVLPIQVLEIESCEEKTLTAFFPAPLSPEVIKEVEFISNCKVIAEVAQKEILKRAVYSAYQGQRNALLLAARQASMDTTPTESTIEILKDNSHSVAQLLHTLVGRGVALSSSDIHIEPVEHSAIIRYRIDGILREEPTLRLTRHVLENLSRRIKVLCKLDITVKYRPQEGAFSFTDSGFNIRLRVSFIPLINGEKIVLRLLDNNLISLNGANPAILTSLGLTIEQDKLLRSFLAGDRGVILLCGPTGSGKSTLLYSALSLLNDGKRNIAAIEDPVERIIPGVNQIEVQHQHNLGYAEYLPALLRQDPDVLMIGEIRETKTAETALTAGLTGHLVLSTIHAGNCLEAFPRLSQLQINSELIASALSLIISQRLLGKNCKKCLAQHTPSPTLRRFFSLEEETVLNTSNGCQSCNFTGIRGRIGIFEFLVMTNIIKEIIRSYKWNTPHQSEEQTYGDKLLKAARSGGYQPYAFGIRDRLLSGEISPTTALRALGVSEDLL